MGTVANVSLHQTILWHLLTAIAFLRDYLEFCREAGRSGRDEMPWECEPYPPDDGEIVTRP
jgi:hypothetical protein